MNYLFDLPPEWRYSNLEEVARSVGGGTPSKSDATFWADGTIPWVSPKDMKTFNVTSSEDTLAAKALDRLSLIPTESVLVVVRSGILSRTLPVALNKLPVTINQDMRAFVPESGISAKYLAWQLMAREREVLSKCKKHGTTVASIEGPALARFPLAIAPTIQQTRIVAKLEELLSDLDAGVAELKAAQKKLGQYRQSLLKAAVEGALTAEWRKQQQAPLSPRGRGAGGEGANTPKTDTWFRHRARELRKAQTPAEHDLWQQLRAKRFSGFKFRRQQVIGNYIVDFVCFDQKLVIELDGSQHAEAKERDESRDRWLSEQGFRVLRFWNNEWMAQAESVLETIWSALHKQPPLPNPSPTRGEGLNAPFSLDGLGGASETGAQLLERILTERRARWEAKQLAKFKEQGKTPPKDWQAKYPEPVQPDTTDLPELPEGWVWSSIGECFYVGVGATPSRKEPNYWNGEIPWVSSGEVQFSRIAKTRERITQEGLNNSSTQINPVGSVMLGMIGEGKTRGQVSILDIEAANNQNCAAIWVSNTDIQSEYVYYWLWSQYEQTRRGSSGNNQPALNKSIVESIPFPLPPSNEISEIVALVSTSMDQIERQEQSLELSFKQSSAQRQNILRAAFSGQLVPQDPNDEPASVLLERIRAERAAREAVKKPRGRKVKESAHA